MAKMCKTQCKSAWIIPCKSHVKLCGFFQPFCINRVKLHFPTHFSRLSHQLSHYLSTPVFQLFFPLFHHTYYYNYKIILNRKESN